jgi:sensor histidine kinase YesM
MLIYASIRLVTDTPAGDQFWKRSFRQNMVEIVFVVFTAYLFGAIVKWAICRFNNKREAFSMKHVVFEFGMFLLICMLFINPVLLLIHFLADDPVDWADFTIANIIILLYVMLYYAIVRGNILIRDYIEQKTHIERLKNEQLQTELKFLKAQYHPHFLFNALNTIYFQMDESVPSAKETIEKFSELLRYQLYDQAEKVPIQQEIDHLKNFIYLQKQRSSEKLELELFLDQNFSGKKIYPLLLLPLVENAFKYAGGDHQIKIEAKMVEGQLIFSVRNSLPNRELKKGGGLGLDNLERRLKILYPQKHHLTIIQTKTDFMAELKLHAA